MTDMPRPRPAAGNPGHPFLLWLHAVERHLGGKIGLIGISQADTTEAFLADVSPSETALWRPAGMIGSICQQFGRI